MKYAILLRDWQKIDVPQIEEYCAISGFIDSQKDIIKALLKSGKGVLPVSELLNCSYQILYHYLKKHPEIKNG